MTKKIMIISFIICLFLLSVSLVRAENYVSKDFPPDNVIAKTIGGDLQSIGKFKDMEGNYILYFFFNKETTIREFTLRKLDTNIWLYTGGMGEWKILQK